MLFEGENRMSASGYNYAEIHALEIKAGMHVARIYDHAYESLFYETTRKMVSVAAIHKNKAILKVLDLGCGTGNLTKFLSGKAMCSLVAVDISLEMLNVAKNKLPKVRFLSCAVEEMPFKARSFDVVVGYSVLHHLPDLGRLFNEVSRVLKPAGSFVFAEPVESFLGKHKTLFRSFKFPFYPLYLFLRKKNSKYLSVFQNIDFHAFTTSVHRNLSEKEIVNAMSRTESATFSFQIDRLGILSPWLGGILFNSNYMDRLLFRIIWSLDIVLSRILRLCTSEIFIKGTVKTQI